MASTEALSDYEKLRATNIQRNNDRLRALGLLSAQEEEESNALAWKQQHTVTASRSITNDDKNKKRKRPTPAATSSRKSLRLQGKQPNGIEIMMIMDDHDNNTNNNNNTSGTLEKEREARVRECRQVRMRLALEYAAKTDAEKKAAKENPTATYEHTAMRIRTMTEKGLKNRVKAIERAAGKHSVIKMAIFKSCLQDHGLWELAYLASVALERLKALKAPGEEDTS
jgi:hypothetical protein